MQRQPGILNAFRNAARGIGFTVRTQPNARVHLVVTLLVISAGIILDITRNDWHWLIAAIAAVWVAELFNTAIEQLTDLVTDQWHPLARNAKDIAAGAVLITAVSAAVIGFMIFAPYIFGR